MKLVSVIILTQLSALPKYNKASYGKTTDAANFLEKDCHSSSTSAEEQSRE